MDKTLRHIRIFETALIAAFMAAVLVAVQPVARSEPGLGVAIPQVIGASGATVERIRYCPRRRIFFENCWWWAVNCPGTSLQYYCISCPDLPSGRCAR